VKEKASINAAKSESSNYNKAKKVKFHCNICDKNGHSDDRCWFKNKPYKVHKPQKAPHKNFRKNESTYEFLILGARFKRGVVVC
jgi:hypothetical protein